MGEGNNAAAICPGAAFKTDALNRAYCEMLKLQDMSSSDFYAAHPELEPFDNGHGFFTLAENKKIGISEFEESGRTIPSESKSQPYDRNDCLAKASEKLKQLLQDQQPLFKRFVITKLLDSETARSFLINGGYDLIKEDLPESATFNGIDFLSFNSDMTDEMTQIIEEMSGIAINEAGNITAIFPLECIGSYCLLMEYRFYTGSGKIEAYLKRIGLIPPYVSAEKTTDISSGIPMLNRMLSGLAKYLDHKGEGESALRIIYLKEVFRIHSEPSSIKIFPGCRG